MEPNNQGRLAAPAAHTDRSGGGPALRPGDGQDGGALWNRDCREHHPKGHFGSQGSCLLDFYRVCHYLGGAAHALGAQPAAQQARLTKQKERLKTHSLGSLLNELRAHLEPPQTPDEEAPVRQCHRYLAQRQDQLDYEGAINQGLPIGSGEIESVHRYAVQKRLKLPGASS